MQYTLKNIFNRVKLEIPEVTPYEVYQYWNLAVELISNKNFLQENTHDLAISSAGIGDLSTVTNGVRKVTSLYDHHGFSLICVGDNKEYISKYAARGENRYAIIGNSVYTKPAHYQAGDENTIVSTLISFITNNQIKYNGNMSNFWREHGMAIGTEFAVSGSDDNDGTYNVALIFDESYSGVHEGSDDDSSLKDETNTFPVDGTLIGKTIYNYTSRGYGVILSNTDHLIYAEMISNYRTAAWKAGDVYEIILRDGSIITVEEETILTEAAGDQITITPTSYIYSLTCYEGLPKFSSFAATETVSVHDYVLPTILYYVIHKLYNKMGASDQSVLALKEYQDSLTHLINTGKLIKEGGRI